MRSRISSRSGKTPTLIPHPQASQAGIRDIAVASQCDECRDGRVLWLSIWAEHHATTQERTLHPPCVPDATCSVERKHEAKVAVHGTEHEIDAFQHDECPVVEQNQRAANFFVLLEFLSTPDDAFANRWVSIEPSHPADRHCW